MDINNGVVNHMCGFLPILDVLSLRNVSSDMKKKINVLSVFKTHLKRTIIRICLKSEYTQENFAKASLLIQTVLDLGGMFSGSCILQILLGEEWKSDIDVYVPAGNTSRVEKVERIGQITLPSINSSVPDVYMMAHAGSDYLGRCVYRRNLNSVAWDGDFIYSLIYDSKDTGAFNNLQIIEHSLPTTPTDYFDMTQCMNYYDGVLWSNSIDLLRRRIGYMYRSDNARADKYVNRGFKIVDVSYHARLKKLKIVHKQMELLKKKLIDKHL